MAGEKRRKNRALRVLSVVGKVFGTMVLVGVLTAAIFVCLFAVYVKNDLSKQIDLDYEGFSLDQTSVIYAQNAKTGEWEVLQELYATENRTWVSIEGIPADLRFATIAIEDKRFRDHHGVDWLRTAKASVNMFLGGSSSYGASTITQQLIKNLTGQDEVTVRRKLIEIFRALEFEKRYTKDDILEWYLNTIYMGEGCYGVQSAAHAYFGKSVDKLSLAECASLIAITNNPSIYDPYINPEKNRSRQMLVLGAMLDQGFIDQSEYDQATAQEMVFRSTSLEDTEDTGNIYYYSYFVDQVLRDVIADLCEATGYSYEIVEQMVKTGGYQIYCTIDPDVQQCVDQVYTDLANIPQTESTQQLQSAIVVIDNKTGDIVAMAGGVGEKSGSLTFNRAVQSLLSPGSTIKPLSVYAPALDLGIITPVSVYDDTPHRFTDDEKNNRWPKNSDNVYRGLMSIDQAVGLSVNTIPVKLVAQMGPEYCYTFAKEKMGLDTLVSEWTIGEKTYTDVDLAPLAMGGLTRGVTVQAMAEAYASFPNDGEYRTARTYTKVVDAAGNVVLENEQERHQAIKPQSAWYITHMLENAVQTGTGTGAQLENMAVAGKTGTTTSNYDRWFCGYTPYYTAAVWCGYDNPEEIRLPSGTPNPAVTLWHDVFAEIHSTLSKRSFSTPSNVISCQICQDSGLLATEACKKDPRGSRVVEVELSIYDVPTTYCATHELVEVCGTSNQVANRYCRLVAADGITKVGLLRVERAYPIAGIVVQDQRYVFDAGEIPGGWYTASCDVETPIGGTCTQHTAASLVLDTQAGQENPEHVVEAPPEPEEEEQPEPEEQPVLDE